MAIVRILDDSYSFETFERKSTQIANSRSIPWSLTIRTGQVSRKVEEQDRQQAALDC